MKKYLKSMLVFSLFALAFLLPSLTAHATGTRGFPNIRSTYAEKSYNSFLRTYWDPKKGYFYMQSDHNIDPTHQVGPENGRYSDYWWEAQSFDLVLDHYQRTRSPRDHKIIEQAYYGFLKAYPNYLQNDYNDDIGWWANYLARAYQLTGEKKFLATSKKMFNFILGYEDSTFGGGIWWKNTETGPNADNEKNVATNGTAAMTATRLYRITGQRHYLNTATRLFSFLKDNYYHNGRIVDRIRNGQPIFQDWTYDYGQFANAAFQLYRLTGKREYYLLADKTYDYSIKNVAQDGILPAEGNYDAGGFKGIYVRDLAEFAQKTHSFKYSRFLQNNAYHVVMNQNSQGLSGNDWTTKTPETATQSHSAASGVILLQYAYPLAH